MTPATDSIYHSKDFQNFFSRSTQSLVMEANLPHFTIVAVSDDYLALVHKQRAELLGKGLFEVFPGSGADPSEQFSVFSSFRRVIETNAPDELPVFKYEIFIHEKKMFETHYWTNVNQPILDENGKVRYIINTTTNITTQIKQQEALEASRERENALNQQLLVSNEELSQTYQQLLTLNSKLEERVKQRTAQIAYTSRSLQMAIDAGELASFSMNTADRVMLASARMKEFYGFDPDEDVSFEAAILQIHEDYRGRAVQMVEETIANRTRFEIEYPVFGFRTGRLRWVRAIGEVQDNEGKSYFTGVLQDITEKKQDEIRKNDFIAMVSHELKTPLTSMKGYLQLLQSILTNEKDAFKSNILDQANRQIIKMTTMINGFLNVSRLESGKMQILPQPFDMALLLQDMQQESEVINSTHPVIFLPVAETWVNADRDKIGHVINNLISNAVKYSPIGSAIHIAASVTGTTIRVSVKDNGRGISEQDLPRLFERYYRVADEKINTIAGFGIGLYLCYEIIKQHNGIIWAESQVGRGSTFYFTLPLLPHSNHQ